MKDYIYVGSFEHRWKRLTYKRQLATTKALIMVNYNSEYDSIVEECWLFDELDESLVTETLITITNFEQQVSSRYSPFIRDNIKLLRHRT